MPSREDEDRERQHPGRWERETAGQARSPAGWPGPSRREAAPAPSERPGTPASPAPWPSPAGPAAYAAPVGWGHPSAGGPAGGVGSGRSTTIYGSGRWSPREDDLSGPPGESASGYGQAVQGQSGYGRSTDFPPGGTGTSERILPGHTTTYPAPPGSHEAGQALPPDPARMGTPDLHERDYQRWRDEQMRSLDEDYEAWRQDRYHRFVEEFNRWRQNRHRAGAQAADLPGRSGPPAAPAPSSPSKPSNQEIP